MVRGEGKSELPDFQSEDETGSVVRKDFRGFFLRAGAGLDIAPW